MKKRTMSVQEVASYLGLHKDTVYDLVKENKLPHFKVGGGILFFEDVLIIFLLKGIFSTRYKRIPSIKIVLLGLTLPFVSNDLILFRSIFLKNYEQTFDLHIVYQLKV